LITTTSRETYGIADHEKISPMEFALFAVKNALELDEKDLNSLQVSFTSGQSLFLDRVLSSASATTPTTTGGVQEGLPVSSSVTKSLDEKKQLYKDALK
jgi:hypothetical protein